jgi:hypothetical protein
MSKIKTHIEDCINILGEGFEKVHEWLDAYAKKYNPFLFLERHRQYRHHAEGVEEIGRKWGHYAKQAAKIHIIRDNALYVYCDMNILREDEIEEYYQKALKFCHSVPKNDKWKTDDDLE